MPDPAASGYKCCDHCCHEYDGPPHLNPCVEGCNDDED